MGSARRQSRIKRAALWLVGICLLVLWQAVLGHLLAPPNGCMLGDSYEYLHLANNIMFASRYAYDPAVLTLDKAFAYQAWMGQHRQRGLLSGQSDSALIVSATGLDHLLPTAMRQPLYPLFLAIMLPAAGYRPLLLFVIQAVLVLATVGVAAMISRNAFPSVPAAPVVTTLLLALFVPLMLTSSLVMPEVLSVPLLLSGYLLFATPGGRRRALLAGVCLGMASLAKAVVIPFGAVLVGITALSSTSKLGKARWVFCGAFLLPIVLWSARNFVALGRATPSSGETGVNVWYGAMEREIDPLSITPKQPRIREAEEIVAPHYYITLAASDRLMDAALQEVRRRPLSALGVGLSRVIRVGLLDFPGGRSYLAERSPGLFRAGQLVWIAVWSCYCFAALRLAPSREARIAMWSAGVMVAGSAFVSPQPGRTLMPFHVLMLVWASGTVCHVAGRLRRPAT